MRVILEKATGLTGEIYKGGGVMSPRGTYLHPAATVKFPDDQVFTVDRVSIWVEAENVRLGMWPAEVKTQYTRFYPDPKKVENIVALGDRQGWDVNANFHLAYWHAQPTHRWYPHLRDAEHVRQWVSDFRRGCAGARSRQEVENPRFRQWLVESGYASESELPTLDNWLNDHPTVDQFFIRPGVQVLRTWPVTDASLSDGRSELSEEVGGAIDQALSALAEPRLSMLQPHSKTTKAQAKQVGPPNMCSTCFTVLPVTGICDNCAEGG
jgi:hypothetical protein